MLCDLLYKILLLDSDSSFDLQLATRHYRKIFVCIHPDKCDDPMATEASANLSVAYRILSDDQSRYTYNLFGLAGLEDYSFDEVSLERTHLFICQQAGHVFGHTGFHAESPIVLDDDEEGEDSGREPSPADAPMPDEQPSRTPAPEPTCQAPTPEPDYQVPTPEPDYQVPTPEPTVHQESELEPEPEPNTSREDNSSFNRTFDSSASFRASIRNIVTHHTRRGVLKFKVVWSPHSIEVWERLETVIEEKFGLRAYLNHLRKTRSRSFLALVKKYPFITQVLD